MVNGPGTDSGFPANVPGLRHPAGRRSDCGPERRPLDRRIVPLRAARRLGRHPAPGRDSRGLRQGRAVRAQRDRRRSRGGGHLHRRLHRARLHPRPIASLGDRGRRVTKRAQVHEDATLEWIDVNLGSRRTWKVPRANLVGPGAAAEFVGVAFAGKGQHQDVGAEMVHLAPRTCSRIANHGIVQKGGRATLRSGIRVATGATEVSSSVAWSSLMLDADSRAQTSPSIEVDEADAEIVQEGTVRKVGEEMLFYMSSRGLPADEATRMVVLGIASEATRRIPVEYAVEVDRLLELELEGGIG
ncbi:MAG: hypothetical protein E6K04_01210 [Methanobacteriota archaeon]|nr:MAG: hypothetical protein E6K04_01210 [Euryarchaeota archaeon]